MALAETEAGYTDVGEGRLSVRGVSTIQRLNSVDVLSSKSILWY